MHTPTPRIASLSLSRNVRSRVPSSSPFSAFTKSLPQEKKKPFMEVNATVSVASRTRHCAHGESTAIFFSRRGVSSADLTRVSRVAAVGRS